MSVSIFFDALVEGDVIPQAVAELLHITPSELAATLGLTREAVANSDRVHSPPVQARLRELEDILIHILPWAGSPHAAYAWYRSQSLPSFGGAPAEQLVRDGRADDVRHYLERLAEGGFA